MILSQQLGPVLAFPGMNLPPGSALSYFKTFLQQEKQYSFKMQWELVWPSTTDCYHSSRRRGCSIREGIIVLIH